MFKFWQKIFPTDEPVERASVATSKPPESIVDSENQVVNHNLESTPQETSGSQSGGNQLASESEIKFPDSPPESPFEEPVDLEIKLD